MPTEYDVIVIGSGLAGLTSANTLAKAGHRVLLLEHHYQLGGMATWFRQRHWRRAARQYEADARRARADAADLRAAAAVSRLDQARLPAPSQYGFYGAAGRDKQGATL